MRHFFKHPMAKAALAAVAAAVLVAGCGTAKQPSTGGETSKTTPAPAAEKKVIKFADTQFQTLWVNNAIAGFIVKNGYGYPVETVEMTTPIFQQSIAKGEIDVMMEIWRNNIMDWYLDVTKSGKMLDLGDTYEKSTQGWYVPRYMIEGDTTRNIKATAPDLKSVTDIPKYKQLFADPENPDKGLLINCITGWQCAKINAIKVHAYGLAGEINLQEPGAAAALDAAIVGAYKKGKPFLAYYWEPTWLAGAYDLVQLQEPPYTEECNDAIQAVLKDKSGDMSKVTAQAGCAYETIGIHKGVTSSLKERAPEVIAFLEKMSVGTDPLNKTAAYMQASNVQAEKAAIWFFEQYPDRWHSWVPADVAARVEQAVKEAGAK
jgi:glycine betaine/proline transport system substrate-binding protein